MADAEDSATKAMKDSMGWIDVFAEFESCGISRTKLMNYSIPYIYAVLPKLMERRITAMNPFLAPVEKTQPTGEVYGKNGKLTPQDVIDFCS